MPVKLPALPNCPPVVKIVLAPTGGTAAGQAPRPTGTGVERNSPSSVEQSAAKEL